MNSTHGKKAGVIGVTSMAVVLLGSMAAMSAGPERDAAAQMQSISGAVESVDADERMLKVDREGLLGSSMEFSVTADTAIRRGAESIALQDIRPGERVIVQYAEQGDALVSQSIQVAAASGRPGAPASGTQAQPSAN